MDDFKNVFLTVDEQRQQITDKVTVKMMLNILFSTAKYGLSLRVSLRVLKVYFI